MTEAKTTTELINEGTFTLGQIAAALFVLDDYAAEMIELHEHGQSGDGLTALARLVDALVGRVA